MEIKQLGDPFAGLVEPEAFAGSVVELIRDLVELGLAQLPQLSALGKYWRRSPLVFSLDPRCHGACGSQK